MAKQSGLGDRLYVGAYDLSGDIGSIQRVGGGPAAMDLTDITQSAYGRVGGLRAGEIGFSSWFDKAAGAAHPRLSLLPVADTTVTYLRGAGIGSAGAACIAKQIGYDGTRAADGSFSLAVSAQSNGFGLEWGRQLTAGTRTDTTATNGASLDNTAATAFGGQFYLHVLGFTGTSVTIKIQDSADNATFADLTAGTFSTVTGLTTERIATANNATVRRYLRVATSGTFTSAAFLVVAVRNEAAGVVF